MGRVNEWERVWGMGRRNNPGGGRNDFSPLPFSEVLDLPPNFQGPHFASDDANRATEAVLMLNPVLCLL